MPFFLHWQPVFDYHSVVMHPEQKKALQAMTPAQKLGVAADLRRSAWRMKAAGVRMQHPDWSEAAIEDKVREIFVHAGR